MHNSTIDFAIVGAGWLGKALAIELTDAGKTVVSTCRTNEKVNQLQNEEGLDVLQYQLGDDVSDAALSPLFNANTLILNIAPGSMKQDIDYFIECMKNLIDRFMQTPRVVNMAPCLLFISTTSVYGEQARVVTESSAVEPSTVSALAHVTLEQYLLLSYPERGTVLRLAGLVGEDRHPVRHLVKKSPLSAANKRVNLVDRGDVIQAIRAIISQGIWGETMHLCSHEHPTRRDYYTWAASKLNLVAPVFNDDKANDEGKVIDSKITCEKLGLTLKYDSPYKILTN